MLLVTENDAGAPEVCWTWLPYWLGSNTNLVARLNAELLTEHAGGGKSLEDHHRWLCRRLGELFPVFTGLDEYLVWTAHIT